jgi:hypothetical protein
MTAYVLIENNEIVSYFSCQQSAEYWPGIVEIEDEDERLSKFFADNNVKIYSGPGAGEE